MNNKDREFLDQLSQRIMKASYALKEIAEQITLHGRREYAIDADLKRREERDKELSKELNRPHPPTSPAVAKLMNQFRERKFSDEQNSVDGKADSL